MADLCRMEQFGECNWSTMDQIKSQAQEEFWGTRKWKAEDKVRAYVIQNDTSRFGVWDTKANPSKARTNISWRNNNKVDSKVGDDVTLVEDTWGHKSENTNVNQSKEIESSWDAKKPVENSSWGDPSPKKTDRGLPVPSSMCVSKSHRQPLTGSSLKEDPAGTARHVDVGPSQSADAQ
ncbi:hypothetical protein PIB30_035231 [Stylosanthes scabra]|uniref:Uncharacterized protein n=1 Tax=Stylosanthes scabra TaxID=79078 RepID=A0ABU6TCT0_9FABA|nr:hypothetical protein [Stylosanthes scabra]